MEADKNYVKALELGNSCLLTKYKGSKYPEVLSRAIDHLFEEMVETEEIRLTRASSKNKLRHHIQFFVLNLYKVYHRDPTKVIAYSRDSKWYSDKKGINCRRKFNLSFRYSVQNPPIGKPVITFLEKQGYIKTFGFKNVRSGSGRSYQSRMRAEQKLIDLIEDHYEIDEQMVEEDYSGEETIIVKGLKPKPTYKYVWKDGKRKNKKFQKKRKICKTPNKPIVRQMRANLEIINALMEQSDIRVIITDEELAAINRKRIKDDLDPINRPVDFSRKRLHRAFLDRRLDRGGRFYGPWYQGIQKEFRQYITINGAPTLELDYSAIHPNLIYAIEKATPPVGDMYRLDDYSEDTRNFLKFMFLMMINAKDANSAKGAIRAKAFGWTKGRKKKQTKKPKIKIPAELGRLQDEYLDPVVNQFIEKHEPIRDYFFSPQRFGFPFGNWLMYLDSQITEHILLHYAAQNIPVLPVHDSYIVDARVFEDLGRIMDKAIYDNFEKTFKISNDNLGELFKKMAGIIKQDIIDNPNDPRLRQLESDLAGPMEEIDKTIGKLKNISS
jgi:hypothetical protein